jgi:glycosyltransferase involved in cell wall biosynthesis
MSAKRILILTNRVPYPLNDGGNLAMDTIVNGYQSQGWEVYLLSMNTSRHNVSKQELDRLYKNIYKFETVDINNDVTAMQVIKNLLFSSEPNHATRFYHSLFRDKLKTVLQNFNPDVVHLESVFLSSYLPLIKAQGAFAVLRMHNIEWQVWQRLADETKGALKSWYINNLAKRIKVYEEKVWSQYDLLLPITNHDASIVKTTTNTEAYVVPFGITTKPQTNIAENWAGYHIGAMDWLPNKEAIDWFINDVWPHVHKTVPGFQFYFAGRNMPESYLSRSIEGITCAGEVPDADAFIADKKILIVPLRSGGGIRVKILEAMATGKLVVSTSVGMQGIDAIDRKHYLKADTPEAFAQQIQWAIEHKNEALAITENAKGVVSIEYDARQIAADLSQKLLAKVKK